MFTGIVEELGTVISITAPGVQGGGPRSRGVQGGGPRSRGVQGGGPRSRRLRINASIVLEDAKVGDSTAVNGCCLTVVDLGAGWWEADVTEESFARTNLGDLQPGSPVNLERPVRLMDRLGGHLVQGHVDAVGEIVEPAPGLRVRMPADLLRYIVEKGSITVDGISLTVVDVLDDGFTVALIPHTTAVTTLGHKGRGDRVNLEVDVMAKHVERLMDPYRSDEGAGR